MNDDWLYQNKFLEIRKLIILLTKQFKYINRPKEIKLGKNISIFINKQHGSFYENYDENILIDRAIHVLGCKETLKFKLEEVLLKQI